MFCPEQYELLDFGDGRKLERWGAHVLDRPSPPAEGVSPRQPAAWNTADTRYQRTSGDRGVWLPRLPPAWTVRHDELVFELKGNDFGHVGLFPEQAENWDWLGRQVRAAAAPVRLLNLFAYTGGATLAAAAAGAEVTHVDAARSVVQWARRNAELSGLQEAPIRWITEDAAKFVRREVRRGRRYEAIVLDPPSYGHGPHGEPWLLREHLPALLAGCAELLASAPCCLLLSCHSPGLTPQDLRIALREHWPRREVAGFSLALTTRDGRTLPSGVGARWPV